MATECYSQLGFGFQPKLVVDFAGGTLTTDAGLLLVREFDEQLRLSADVVSRIADRRDPRYITHELDALVRQRLYQIVAGYEDVNDADRLRHDPAFQVVAADGRATLGSQPTLSRLENAIDWPAIQRLARTGVDWFCAYAYGPDEHPADLILDLDSTDDPTHGNQQLALFHGFYDQHMYHPLVWFEGRTGLLLRTRLRPGRDPSATGVVDELRHILPPLRRRFPHTPIFLRGDAGMATPAVEAKLETDGIYYVLGIGTNRVFKARVAPLVAKAQVRYERRGRPVHSAPAFGTARRRGPIHGGFSSRSTSPRPASMCASWSPIAAAVPLISSRGMTTAAPRRIGSRSSSSTSTRIVSAVIASARTPSGCSSTASRCCCWRISDARSSPVHDWRRRRSARFVSTCSKSQDGSYGASDGCGFISRRPGQANRSSRPVIAPSPARLRSNVERDIFFERVRYPPEVSSVGPPPLPPPTRTAPDRGLKYIEPIVFKVERVVTTGDGTVTDSFVNNAG
jgi:hypothetical protein